MKSKKLLGIVLLSVSFCFVSGVGSLAVFAQGFGIGQALAKGGEPLPTEPVSGTEAILAQRAKYATRHTFFFIPVEGVLAEFWTFLDMYPDAEIPEEFALILPSEINNVDKMKKNRNRGFSFYWDFKIYSEFILSLLLTMAYQQDYEIEYVTSNYVILQKFVDKEELKEWEERSNKYKEKGYK